MSTESTIPSPAEAVKASLQAMSETPVADVTPTATEAPKAPAKPEQEAEPVKAEPKTEKPKTFKSLSAALETISDEKPEQPGHEPADIGDEAPRDGEKPAAFIKRLKEERASLQNELKQLREQSAKKAAASPEEIAALKAEIAERDKELEISAFERSKTFKENYDRPATKAEEAARRHIEKFTEEKGVYERASTLDGREQLEYLTDKLGDTAAAIAYQQLQAVAAAKEARAAALADASERSKVLLAEQERQSTTAILDAFDKQAEAFGKKLTVFNSDIKDDLNAQARALLTGEAPPEDIIAAARYAVALPHYIEMLKSERAENATLKARIAEYESDQPGISGRGSDTSRASSGAITPGSLPSISDVVSGKFTVATK